MKIEVLYPELSNLYGDYYNAKYLAMCIPDSQTVFTSNNDKPAFLSEKVDIICMGSMSERNQEFAIKHLMPYKDKIKELIENGTFFLATGNSFEIFGKHIEDDDKKIECLGAIDFYSKRQMNDRRNCFFLGDFQTENDEDDKKNKVLTSECVTDDGLMIETIMNASDDIKRRVIAYYYLICDKDNSDKQG